MRRSCPIDRRPVLARVKGSRWEAAEAVGYVGPSDGVLRDRFDHIIGTLVRLVR